MSRPENAVDNQSRKRQVCLRMSRNLGVQISKAVMG